MCRDKEKCTKADCLFNHPSPFTYKKGKVDGHPAPAPKKFVGAVGGKAGGDGEAVVLPLIADAAEPSRIAAVAKQSEEVHNPLR